MNGDVLDSTEKRLTKRHWFILSLLRRLSDEVELVWVKGNHDFDAESIAHLIGAIFLGSWSFTTNNLRLGLIHGDTFDDFIAKRPIATWVADQIYCALQGVSLEFASQVKQSSKTFLRCCDKVKAGALKYAKQNEWDIVACGHTHHAEHSDRYFNVGSWTEHKCHYLAVSNTNIKLVEF